MTCILCGTVTDTPVCERCDLIETDLDKQAHHTIGHH